MEREGERDEKRKVWREGVRKTRNEFVPAGHEHL